MQGKPIQPGSFTALSGEELDPLVVSILTAAEARLKVGWSAREKVGALEDCDEDCICCRFQPGTRGEYKKVPLTAKETKAAHDFELLRKTAKVAKVLETERLGKTLLFTCKMLKDELSAWKNSSFCFTGLGARNKQHTFVTAQEMIPDEDALKKLTKPGLSSLLAGVRYQMFHVDAPLPINYDLLVGNNIAHGLSDDMEHHPLFNFDMPGDAREVTCDHARSGHETEEQDEDEEEQSDMAVEPVEEDREVQMAIQMALALNI
jgi:hypothetical protein